MSSMPHVVITVKTLKKLRNVLVISTALLVMLLVLVLSPLFVGEIAQTTFIAVLSLYLLLLIVILIVLIYGINSQIEELSKDPLSSIAEQVVQILSKYTVERPAYPKPGHIFVAVPYNYKEFYLLDISLRERELGDYITEAKLYWGQHNVDKCKLLPVAFSDGDTLRIYDGDLYRDFFKYAVRGLSLTNLPLRCQVDEATQSS